ncbi:hypothetical protein IQ254_08570 [Nodosilinea sp. LEGE 07088]|uniref:hypothetical protein n=1 Tax=Nodosilinea sp. LEGE 07088 TaxID=2777968 RepID=UPI00187FA2C0|nr:hypothetical protein [Nodosilinea sp. LEGE 07088]MBE9137259.1 hypothetical protein [Nodosilinea sp. LEGE 07088]
MPPWCSEDNVTGGRIAIEPIAIEPIAIEMKAFFFPMGTLPIGEACLQDLRF